MNKRWSDQTLSSDVYNYETNYIDRTKAELNFESKIFFLIFFRGETCFFHKSSFVSSTIPKEIHD